MVPHVVPESRGGRGLSLPEALRTEEALAWADGSTAWVVTLCSGAGWFAGFLDPDLSKKIFADDKACIAGSGAPGGTAEINGTGFIVNGKWSYASGALHATMFTANCIVTKDGIPLPDANGQPAVKAFIFFRNEVRLVKNWRTMGMVATASHGFAVHQLKVGHNRSFYIDSKAAIEPDPVYQYPFLQLAEATLAVNYSGMAQRFVDLRRSSFNQRSGMTNSFRHDPKELMERAEESLTTCRDDFYRAVETSWSFCSSRQAIPDVVLGQVSNQSHKLYATSLKAVQSLYPGLGLAGADPDSEANRIFRNLFTASQHTLFSKT